MEIGGRRTRMVLACLALAQGQPVSVAGVIDGVWGSDPPGAAANAVQAVVSRLRKALRGMADLESVAGGYRLALARQDVDASRFAELADRGRRELADGDLRLGASTLREALGLWRGAALSDVLDAPFAQVAAARLDGIRARAAEDRFEAEIRLGRASEMLVDIEAACAGSPVNERLAGLRVRALSAVGRQADALAVYEQMRRRLGAELGIEPSDELRGTHVAVLRGEVTPAADPADGADLSAVAPCGLPPDIAGFTGRAEALAALDTLLSADSQTPAVGVVSGVGGGGQVGVGRAVVPSRRRALSGRMPVRRYAWVRRGPGAGGCLRGARQIPAIARCARRSGAGRPRGARRAVSQCPVRPRCWRRSSVRSGSPWHVRTPALSSPRTTRIRGSRHSVSTKSATAHRAYVRKEH